MSPDTQATLLLCGRFGAARTPEPLALREYNGLARWLHGEGARPAALLGAGARGGSEVAARVPEGIVEPERLRALLERGPGLAFAVEEWERRGLWIVGRADAEYPVRVRALGSGSPPILYGAGDLALLARDGLGVVGSREADDAALDVARRVGEACASGGLVVVSGGAKGVDQAAMTGALDAGGVAVGFLAEGVARPAVSRLWRGAVAGGRLALVSAVAPEARWQAAQALGRNRLIYAQSRWALVVAAETRGGTWEGAREALARGRTPVLVRASGEAGNRALVGGGAAPLGVDAALGAPSLADALDEAAARAGGPGDLFA